MFGKLQKIYSFSHEMHDVTENVIDLRKCSQQFHGKPNDELHSINEEGEKNQMGKNNNFLYNNKNQRAHQANWTIK